LRANSFTIIWLAILLLCACEQKQGLPPADIKPSSTVSPISVQPSQATPTSTPSDKPLTSLPSQSSVFLTSPTPVTPTSLPSNTPTLPPSLVNGFRTNAQFSAPTQLVVDYNDILYVADSGHHAIRKILPNGQVITLSGNGFPGLKDGPVAQAQFNNPTGMIFDKNEVLYIADTGNHAIRKISKDGIVSTVVGKGLAGFKDGLISEALLNSPTNLAWSQDGALLITDTQNYRIRKLIFGQGIQTFLYYQIGLLEAITTVLKDKLYAIGGERFLELFSNGEYKEIKLDLFIKLSSPRGITSDNQGNIYITNIHRYGRVLRIDKNGKAEDLVDFYFGPESGYIYNPEKPTTLQGPAGIAVNSQGEIYVAEMFQNRIIKLIPKPGAMIHSLEIFAGK